jgi:hypothetical protein
VVGPENSGQRKHSHHFLRAASFFSEPAPLGPAAAAEVLPSVGQLLARLKTEQRTWLLDLLAAGPKLAKNEREKAA